MFTKLSAVFAVFAVAAQVAVATPPACLVAAVNTQSNPSDIKSVCDAGAADVQKYLSSKCGDNLDAATSAFAETCKSAGVTISSSSSNPTKSSTADHSSSTGTKQPSLSSATLTNGALSGFHTQTANSPGNSASTPTASPAGGSGSSSASDSGSPSGTSSSSAQPSGTGTITSTGGAARLSMDILGLAALGLAGFMLAM